MTITRHESTELALADDQHGFTERQVAALAHIGVESAGQGDLEVFFHVCKRSGLDPFARQIHMIGRNQREVDENGNWRTVVKQTIQTGIDGFRLIGRRAAAQSGHKIAMSDVEWCHENGDWRPVWRTSWGLPVAARVTIYRDGEPFPATALFDEYKQVKSSGDLTRMWATRPAGQLGKCAEALAWRKAFPQDLAGIYVDEEMGQADNPERVTQQARSIDDDLQTSGPEPAPAAPETGPVERPRDSGPESPPLLNTSSRLAKAMYAAIRDAGIAEGDRLTFVAEVIGRDIGSTKEMTEDEAQKVLDHLPQEAEVGKGDQS